MGDISIHHVEAAIGAVARQAFEAELGGARIVIPRTIGAHHPIAHAIGLAASKQLSEAYAGAVIDVPVTARKRHLIEEALRAGRSANSIASSYFCSPRYVWKLKAELAAAQEPHQGDLF